MNTFKYDSIHFIPETYLALFDIHSALLPANNMTITGGGKYSPRNSMENDAWMLGESSEFGEYPEDYEEEDGEEEDEYVGGQESDDVFEAETAETTS